MTKEPMAKEAVQTDAAPAAIGPYSQAIVAGAHVFCSGQIPLDPATGSVPEGIEAQTEQVLCNLREVLTAAGSSLDQVVKTTVFLTDLQQFPRMNAVYEQHFSDPPPARATVEVSALPKGVAVEIEAIALLGPGA
jgi:2-iminobutanoate/2-iminopropanoate deaminase